jgi:hypothetical protein
MRDAALSTCDWIRCVCSAKNTGETNLFVIAKPLLRTVLANSKGRGLAGFAQEDLAHM